MEDDLNVIILEINRLLPQLETFITQFKTVVLDTGVNVITDVEGNMSIDVPMKMSDDEANKISAKVGIIDRLITNNGTSINDLFQKGLRIEHSLKIKDPTYSSQLLKQIEMFKALNSSYKH
jgi:hypothetical protein